MVLMLPSDSAKNEPMDMLICPQNWLPWQCSLKDPVYSHTPTNPENMVKIGLAHPEIIVSKGQ